MTVSASDFDQRGLRHGRVAMRLDAVGCAMTTYGDERTTVGIHRRSAEARARPVGVHGPAGQRAGQHGDHEQRRTTRRRRTSPDRHGGGLHRPNGGHLQRHGGLGDARLQPRPSSRRDRKHGPVSGNTATFTGLTVPTPGYYTLLASSPGDPDDIAPSAASNQFQINTTVFASPCTGTGCSGSTNYTNSALSGSSSATSGALVLALDPSSTLVDEQMTSCRMRQLRST